MIKHANHVDSALSEITRAAAASQLSSSRLGIGGEHGFSGHHGSRMSHAYASSSHGRYNEGGDWPGGGFGSMSALLGELPRGGGARGDFYAGMGPHFGGRGGDGDSQAILRGGEKLRENAAVARRCGCHAAQALAAQWVKCAAFSVPCAPAVTQSLQEALRMVGEMAVGAAAHAPLAEGEGP